MSKWYNKITTLSKRYEVFILTGLLCWLVAFRLLEEKTASWQRYIYLLLVILFVQLPVIIFLWNREWLLRVFSRKQYLLCWLVCFTVYLPAVMFGVGASRHAGASARDTILISTITGLLLELLFVANRYYQKQIQPLKWIQRLSVDRSILITITLMSLILSVMAVSSIGNPAYDKNGQLLLGFEFNGWKVLSRFGTFLGFTFQFLLMYLCGYFFFYVNNKLLVPKVLKQQGLIFYILTGLALVGISYPLIAQLLILLPFNSRMGDLFPNNPFSLENAFGAIAILLVSLPVALALQWSKQNSRIISLEKEKAQTELDLLKQQLNPHFFFNTLNNLYALSLQQSKQTPESILQLSELMRYVIYKAKEPAVPVTEEVKYLEDYMQLQQIRLQRKPDVQFKQDIGDDTPPVAPLLLIVLVENAFKHGIEHAAEHAFLHLSLQASANRLYFSCVNSFEQDSGKTAGIGLANLKKRLALLYPGKHLLKTAIENHTFKAELELELS
jgi:sensor histidine kinase YesM